MRKAIAIIFICIFTVSCKKDPPEYPDFLKEDKAIFIGNWEWIYSDHDYGNCLNMSFYEVINPTNSGVNHQLIFSPNGIMRHVKNGITKRDYELFITHFYNDGGCFIGQDYTTFGIDLNNNSDTRLFGCLSEDTLLIRSGFLYEDYEEGCEFYDSYFVKQ